MNLLNLLSPTLVLARLLKSRNSNLNYRTNVIKNLNSFYLSIAVISVFGLVIFQEFYHDGLKIELNKKLNYLCLYLWGYFLLSRCNEIFWAFLKDAFDKMDNTQENKSTLTPSERIKLSLKSYLELIINFAILYSLLPQNYKIWGVNSGPESITDALYFSGVTITTLGYGDISPNHWWPQFLTVYEVFCGFILLIVCFSIYAGRLGDKQHSETQTNKESS